MPEEINRVLTDRISTLLLCPTETAVNNLKQEGFPFAATGADKGQKKQRIENIGDVMYDVVLYYRERAKERVNLESLQLQEKAYALCTLHRQENTDNPARLNSILSALRTIAQDMPVVLPLHPRTKAKLAQQNNHDALKGLTILDPVPYLEMQRLQMSAQLILTDSGGMQKEAYFHQVPCITLRDETEWVETVEAGWNQLVGANENAIMQAVRNAKAPAAKQSALYGNGNAALKIISVIGKNQ
jgi:UDP-GlcNAc3NAcA epimerase